MSVIVIGLVILCIACFVVQSIIAIKSAAILDETFCDLMKK